MKTDPEGKTMKKSCYANIFAGLLLVALWGCDSGSGTTAGTTGTRTVSPDLSKVDTARGSGSASISVGLSAGKSADSVAKAEGLVAKGIGTATGDDAVAGCEARQLFDEGIRMSKQVALFNCYLEKAEAAVPEFTCGTSEFENYQFNIKGGGPADKGFTMQVRCKTVGDARTVHVCEGSKQAEGLTFTTTDSTRTVAFGMKHHFTSAQDGAEDKDFCDVNGDGSVSDAERAQCRSGGSFDEWGQLDGSVVFDAAASGAIDNLSEFDSANVTGLFDGNFGKGSMTVTYDEDGSPSGGQANTVLGGFNNSFGAGDSGTGFMYAEFNSAEGSAKYSHTGTMPCVPGLPSHLSGCHCPNFDSCDPATQFDAAACKVAAPAASCYCLTASTSGSCTLDQSGTEHFTISLKADGKPQFKIASTSIFASNVTAKTLPTAVTSIAKNFGAEAWDCSAQSFTQINIGDEKSLFAACFALEAETFENSDHDTCFQDQGEDFVKEGEVKRASLNLPE